MASEGILVSSRGCGMGVSPIHDPGQNPRTASRALVYPDSCSPAKDKGLLSKLTVLLVSLL